MAAVGRDEELLEVPLHVACRALSVRLGRQLCVDGITVVPVDVDLGRHREGDAVGGRAEGCDLLRGPRLLAAELVGREAQHGETLALEFLLQRFELSVLRGEPAAAGDVDDERGLAVQQSAEGRLFALQRGDGQIKKCGHGRAS